MIMTSSYKVVETRLCCNMMSPFFVLFVRFLWYSLAIAPHEKLDALCCNVWLAAGRSVQHTCVRSALADITIVAFRLLVALRATASLSWRGLHSYLRAEQQ